MAEQNFTTAEIIASGHQPDTELLGGFLNRVDRQQLAQLSGRPLAEIEALFNPEPVAEDVRKLDIELPGGVVFRNVNSNEDVGRVMQIMQALNLSPEALAKLIAGPNPTPVPATIPAAAPSPVAPSSSTQEGGITIQEMVPRYATRKRKTLAAKSLYEYGNYQRKFVAWLEAHKRNKHIPIHSISRHDIAGFIEDLQEEGLADRTIGQKYLPALNGLFELAQTMGILPEGQPLVSRGHQVFSKKSAKKAEVTNSYKPFTDDELKIIFKPELLSKAERPADFWLPLMGLFTGGRIAELCQLDIADIQQHQGIWAISINADGQKSLKTLAARRLIPIHATLIDCGFLDYVQDAKQHGVKLFPYLTSDKFGSYGATPSERWGDYLDTLGITDAQKVFHSFRSTSNNRLKQSGVPEESRCQFIGHEHDTINSTTYANPHNLAYLQEHVASKLSYPGVDFGMLKYSPQQFSPMLAKLCADKARREAHKQARARLNAGQKK